MVVPAALASATLRTDEPRTWSIDRVTAASLSHDIGPQKGEGGHTFWWSTRFYLVRLHERRKSRQLCPFPESLPVRPRSWRRPSACPPAPPRPRCPPPSP